MPFYDAITEFIFVQNSPSPSDIIFVPGGVYGEVALHAAELYHRKLAPLILVSGKYSILTDRFTGAVSPAPFTRNPYTCESDFLGDILLQNGVPEAAIIYERRASYTYENAKFSKTLVNEQDIHVHSAILSCQAYHARRCLLYYQEQFPDTDFYVSPVETRGINRNSWHSSPEQIDIVLQELERCGSQFHEIMKSNIEK